MIERIVSFGFRHGCAWGTVIDVRQYFPRNPWHDPSLRALTGLDELVAKDIQAAPDYKENYARLLAAVKAANTQTVALGCTGGRHRSVYFANAIGKELRVPVEHMDIHKRREEGQ